jgi:hypothetical protein
MTDQPFVQPPARPMRRRPVWVRQLRPVGGAGLAAAVLIAVAEVADVVRTWAFWHGYGVARDYVAGRPEVTGDDLDAADRLNSATAWGYLICVLVAGVVFLVWLSRARRNAEVLCDAPHRRGRGWVIGGWFCPVVNLWFPYQVVDDVERASRPDNHPDLADLRSMPGSTRVGVWWALWLAGLVINRFAWTVLRGTITLEAIRTAAIAYTLSTMLLVGAAGLMVMIMRRISAWQSPEWPQGAAG